jgi:hypothetical protein
MMSFYDTYDGRPYEHLDWDKRALNNLLIDISCHGAALEEYYPVREN